MAFAAACGAAVAAASGAAIGAALAAGKAASAAGTFDLAVGWSAVATAGVATAALAAAVATAGGAAVAAMAELLSLLLGLQLLPVWNDVATFLFATQASLLLSCFLPFSSSRIGGALAALGTHARRIGVGEVDALVASARLNNQSGQGACSDALLV